MIYHVVCLQKKGQFSLSAPSTDIDAVKATTVARTKERRIFCEDVVWDQINLKVRVARRPFMRQVMIFMTMTSAVPADRHLQSTLRSQICWQSCME
ncbi:hypothetical protein BDR06DRAFT_138881 [Suillus hirtellus]|nr:hypothetical protein BDR06DRAFT_138881 [Suillus hirtellus]